MDDEIELPPFDGSARSIAVLQAALREIGKEYRQSQDKIGTAIDLFVAGKRQSGEWHVPTPIDQRTISAFLKKPPDSRFDLRDFPRAIWEWIASAYPAVLITCNQTTLRVAALSHPVSAAIHKQLSPGRAPDMAKIAQLEGRYSVYRRFFHDPDRIMVADLFCGVGDDPAVFRMAMKYEGPGGQQPADTVDGYLIPYESGVLFQGRFVEMTGPFVAAVTRFNIDSETNHFSRGEGVVLAGAGGDLPSAFPLLMVRTKNPLEAGVYDPDTLRHDKLLWPLLKQMLRRGHAFWRELD